MSSTTFKLIPKTLCKQKPALMRLVDDERIYEYATNIPYMKHVTVYLSINNYAYLQGLFKQVR